MSTKQILAILAAMMLFIGLASYYTWYALYALGEVLRWTM